MTTLRAWLELTRGANLPTVWSNVLIGFLVAVAFGATMDASTAPALGALLLGVSLLYTGGMFLNDACDVDWDKLHRPERPIPSGRLSLRSVRIAAALALAAGAGLLLRVSSSGPSLAVLAVLLAAILAYSRWHKGNPFAPALMGLCRAALPLVGYLAFAPDCDGCAQGSDRLVLAHAAALGLYTASVSLLARHEAMGGKPSGAVSAFAGLALLPVPASLLGVGSVNWTPLIIWTAGLGFGLVWTASRIADLGQRVAVRIAGLALLDYQVWLVIRAGFDRADPPAMGGLMLLLFFGTALALRRLLPST